MDFEPNYWDKMLKIDPQFREARFHAVSSRRSTFDYRCRKCKTTTRHHVDTGDCLRCHPNITRPLRAGESETRIKARLAGRKMYDAPCRPCGTVRPHHVRIGRCATCFTTTGVKRGKVIPPSPHRHAAKQAGLSVYRDACPLHGDARHNTIRGQCLECRTTTGKPRDDYYMSKCLRCGTATVHDKATGGCINHINYVNQ